MAERHLENLGAAIWRLRDDQGLSRHELGDQVGAVEKTVERWEKGENAGAMESLPAIARELGTSPDAIMALAVKIGEERDGDEVPAKRDRMMRLEQKMDAVLAALGSNAPPTEKPSHKDVEKETRRQAKRGERGEQRKTG